MCLLGTVGEREIAESAVFVLEYQQERKKCRVNDQEKMDNSSAIDVLCLSLDLVAEPDSE